MKGLILIATFFSKGSFITISFRNKLFKQAGIYYQHFISSEILETVVSSSHLSHGASPIEKDVYFSSQPTHEQINSLPSMSDIYSQCNGVE